MFASEIKGIQKLTALGRYKKNTIRLLHKNMIMVLEWKRTDYQVDYVARGESVRYHKMEEQDSEEFFINSNYTDYDTEKYNTFYHEWQDNYLDISAICFSVSPVPAAWSNAFIKLPSLGSSNASNFVE